MAATETKPLMVAVSRLKPHASAGLVPRMRSDEWTAFLADVSRRGVQEPLVVQVGDVILDGLNRHEAATMAEHEEVPVRYVDLPEKEQVDYIIRSALLRRHLSDDQRAILAARFQPEISKAAREERARKAGEAGGRGRPKQDSLEDTSAPKLSESKKKSRKEAAEKFSVPERKVRAASQIQKSNPELADKVLAGEVPLAQAKREVERVEKRKELEKKAKAAPVVESPDWRIVLGDSTLELDDIASGSVRLVFADPPYNIGIDYGKGVKADLLPEKQFLDWCETWIIKCAEKLTKDGSFWLMIGDEYADHFGLLLRQAGLHRRAWIKWYETFGVNNPNNFNRCSRHIFYCVKDAKRFVFNTDAVNRLSDRAAKYNDKRADPGGKIWDDVWTIPRLVGNAKERIPDFPTQLPLELVNAIVGCASDPGDTVLDPFTGSATTGVAAITQGRRFIGIEQSKKFHHLAEMRLKGI